MSRISDALVKTLRGVAAYNPETQVAPACILWPDRDRQWEPAIPRLREDMPELLALGEYNPGQRTGPAIWLRCAVAGTLNDISLPAGRLPALYLPGVSRQDLRAVENCPEHLKPLAELQYRSVIWSQANTKDWTILAFLRSDKNGLGLDVAQDANTKNAMQLAIYQQMDERVEPLKGKHLDKDYFNGLLTSGDIIRDILQWLDHPDDFRARINDSQWKAFVELSKSQLAFDPQKEGALAGAKKLALHEGPWDAAWARYGEAPKRYANIPAQIRKCDPPSNDLLWNLDDGSRDGWPQWNEQQEASLRQDLAALSAVPPHVARQKLLELEQRHGRRRQLVWAELGEATLAQSLRFLSILAETTKNALAAGSAEDLATGYRVHGWRADDAVARSLAAVSRQPDVEVVSATIRAIYLPWVEDSARHLQKEVYASGYPGGTIDTVAKSGPFKDGECIVFVDGLRFDAAKRLGEKLINSGCEVAEKLRWAALPTVTATGKAAVSPVREKMAGAIDSSDFEPCVAQTGQSLKGGYQLKKLLVESGWKILDRFDNGDGQGRAWCEGGDIDRRGHDHGWQMAKQLDGLITDLSERVKALLEAGWSRVRVVTDHGWLLLPGGMPKTNLPIALVEERWGRCASLKPGAATQERLYPWFWNPARDFALADGVSCFHNGEEYAHGGLSLQECLTLEMEITMPAKSGANPRKLSDVIWKGLRCTVAVEGDTNGLSLDIRTQPGESSTSIVVSTRPVREDGTTSVIVENDDLMGHTATIVLLNANGGIEAQADTVIGGGKSSGA